MNFLLINPKTTVAFICLILTLFTFSVSAAQKLQPAVDSFNSKTKVFNSKIVESKVGIRPDHRIFTHANGTRTYFKTRTSCRAMIPTSTFFLAEALDLKIIPPTGFLKTENFSGVAMTYLEGYRSLTDDDRELFMDKLSLSEVSRLNIIRFLSGAYDENLGNYMIKGDDLKAIDNDGSIIQYGEYSDWPYVAVNPNIEIEEIKNFPFKSSKSLVVKEALKLIQKKHTARFSAWKARLSPKNSPNWPDKIDIIETASSVWIKRARTGGTYQHLRYVENESLEKLKHLNKELLAEVLKPMKACGEQKNYIRILLQKRDDLLALINDENYFLIL